MLWVATRGAGLFLTDHKTGTPLVYPLAEYTLENS